MPLDGQHATPPLSAEWRFFIRRQDRRKNAALRTRNKQSECFGQAQMRQESKRGLLGKQCFSEAARRGAKLFAKGDSKPRRVGEAGRQGYFGDRHFALTQ